MQTTITDTYYIYSSVLGKPIVEVNGDGMQTDGYIYAAGALLAKESGRCQTCQPSVVWQEANPLTGSRYEVDTGGGGRLQERDPMGANTGIEDLWLNNPEPTYGDLLQQTHQFYLDGGGDPFSPSPCSVDGVPWDCGVLRNGNSAAQCPDNNCGPQMYLSGGRYVLSSPFMAFANGRSGYNVPVYGSVNEINEDGSIDRGEPGIIDWFFKEAGDNDGTPSNIDKCLEIFGGLAAGLRNGLLNSIPQTGYFGGGSLITRNVSALEMLQTVARAETVNGDPNQTISAALLAVIWQGETSVGDFTASANVSMSKGKNPGDVDYGPFQLNYNQIKKEVGLGLYKIDDFGEKAVFGSKTTSPNTAFDGSPAANMMVAARKLKANGGIQDRNRVKAYVGNDNWVATRQVHFDTYFPKWQSFFNCIK